MSGRNLILVLVVSAAVMGWFFYQTLQQSPQFKHLAMDQMAVEYVTYVKTFQKVDRLSVGEANGTQYFVSVENPWKFELHDKTLVAYVPPLQSEPTGQTPTPEVLISAKSAVEKSLLIWLEDKYHTKKDLLVDVRLPN